MIQINPEIAETVEEITRLETSIIEMRGALVWHLEHELDSIVEAIFNSLQRDMRRVAELQIKLKNL